MKKWKKAIALLIGAAMTISAMPCITADAILYFTEDPVTTPEGYEEFDDAGLLSWVGNVSNEEDYCYAPYMCATPYDILYRVYHNFTYNYVSILVSDVTAYKAIYEQYRDRLSFDWYTGLYQEGEFHRVTMYDRYNTEGVETKDPTTVEDKSEAIQEMCKELYDAGCITEAYYTPCRANYAQGSYSNGMYVFVEPETEESGRETLQTIASEFSEDSTVSFSSSGEDGYAIYNIIIEADHAVDLMYAIKEIYPSAWGRMGMFLASDSNEVEFDTVDILAELEKSATTHGDLNQDGKVTVLDAITLSKANIQAIMLNESQTAAADCNGDGLIDSADVTALLCYLTDKVDALPVTIE
ncbi:MAG: dockerin type I repeat-containing protein [Ruminococcus sp.]|nr:dockerin type I repeat-containing protein [Ruminococcus sp.]